MAAPAEARRDRDVVVAARTQADLESTVALLLDHGRDVSLPRGPHHVDQVVGPAPVEPRRARSPCVR